MQKNTRAKNLGLIRFLNINHKSFATKLESVTNSAYLSEMISGKRTILDVEARQIEKILLLPEGWMDRDDDEVIHMSNLDYKIFKLTSSYAENTKKALIEFLSAQCK